MPDLSSWSLTANVLALLVAAGVIAWSGIKLASLADRIADRTGLGEAVTGTVFLTGIAILMNVTLLLGLLYRQRTGPANIGFESVTMLTLYVGGFLVVSLLM